MPGTTFDFDIDRYLNPYIPRSRINLLPKPVSWLLGYRSTSRPPVGRLLVALWSLIGAVAGISIVEAVYHTEPIRSQGTPIIIASLGAAAILEYNVINSPLAQPRPAILGQLFATVIGVGITKLFARLDNFEDLRWLAGALSVGVVSAVMTLTNTVHPPAGATALVPATNSVVTELGWFFVPVVLLGTVLILGTACLVNNIQRTFPVFWWTPEDLVPTKNEDVENTTNGQMGDEGREKEDMKPSECSIHITGEEIIIPNWLSLSHEEHEMLEVLRSKLQGLGLGHLTTRGSDKTCIPEQSQETTRPSA